MDNAVGSDVIAAAIEVVDREARAVGDISSQIDQTFVAVASRLMACKGKVIVSGVGTSGFIARRAAHIFAVSGTPSLFLHPTEGLHGSLGALRSEDVLIVLSKGGSSAEVNELARRARNEGIYVIALTSKSHSDLVDKADIAVVLRPDNVADPGGVIALGSTLAHGAWLDAMSVVLMRAQSYDWKKVLFTHPGGAVGEVVDLPPALAPLKIPPVTEDGQG